MRVGNSLFVWDAMSSAPRWATQREAALALKISERTLQRLRKAGLLPTGTCWVRKVPSNMNSHVVYDLSACEHQLSAATIAAQLEQDSLGHKTLEAVA